jgi:hypothetical protein
MNDMIERRKYERYQVNENVFTCCRLRSPKVAEVVDISQGGLAFSYVGKVGSSNEFLELDIVFPDGTDYISKLPCKTVGERALGDNKRRCGAVFGKLTSDHRAKLKFFIQNYCSNISDS